MRHHALAVEPWCLGVEGLGFGGLGCRIWGFGGLGLGCRIWGFGGLEDLSGCRVRILPMGGRTGHYDKKL